MNDRKSGEKIIFANADGSDPQEITAQEADDLGLVIGDDHYPSEFVVGPEGNTAKLNVDWYAGDPAYVVLHIESGIGSATAWVPHAEVDAIVASLRQARDTATQGPAD